MAKKPAAGRQKTIFGRTAKNTYKGKGKQRSAAQRAAAARYLGGAK